MARIASFHLVRERPWRAPLAMARLQAILGGTLRELGNAAKAAELLEKARTTRERELGAEHLSTLTTLNNLALAYRDAGKLPEAMILFEQGRDDIPLPEMDVRIGQAWNFNHLGCWVHGALVVSFRTNLVGLHGFVNRVHGLSQIE